MVKLLLKNGADPHEVTFAGQKASAMAATPSILRILLREEKLAQARSVQIEPLKPEREDAEEPEEEEGDQGLMTRVNSKTMWVELYLYRWDINL